jgi:hypothetical protein
MSDIDFLEFEQAISDADVAIAIYSKLSMGDRHGQRTTGVRIMKGASILQDAVESASPVIHSVVFLPVDDAVNAETAAFVFGDAEHWREGEPSDSALNENRRSVIRLLIKAGRSRLTRPTDAT